MNTRHGYSLKIKICRLVPCKQFLPRSELYQAVVLGVKVVLQNPSRGLQAYWALPATPCKWLCRSAIDQHCRTPDSLYQCMLMVQPVQINTEERRLSGLVISWRHLGVMEAAVSCLRQSRGI